MNVSWINTLLLLLSFILALTLPFHLFLFAYAVLGPLHYLSEIAWLHDKNYFTDKSFKRISTSLIWLMGIFAFFGAIIFSGTPWLALLLVFSLTALLTSPYSIKNTVFIFSYVAIAAYLFYTYSFLGLLFAILLPTLVHVYIFTFFFMLQGALIKKSFHQSINAFSFLSLPLLFFIITPLFFIDPTSGIQENYLQSFSYLHETLFSLVAIPYSVDALFNSALGIAFMQFIAFAYTYHYLNWFSKTSVIGWTVSARKYKYIILLGWIFSLYVYFIDYRAGISLLAFLSFIHVILEFPLNHMSYRTIWSRLKK